MSALLFLFFLFPQSFSIQAVEKTRTFEVDYNRSVFLMDGEEFRYQSGEIHYFRVPRFYWKDRLHKIKAAGFNTISTYIEWSFHESEPNEYKFEGEQDVVHFIQLAQKEGLYVILRPGPYICAERDFGGYPAWLLTINPRVKLRTADPSHTFFVARWFRHLMPRLIPLLYGNGGPVIMVQVENEYGSYPIHDTTYLTWLRDLYRSYIRSDAVLFTTDGNGYSSITRGMIPGLLATVDFGPSSKNVSTQFEALLQVQPKGPLVNSEYYAGWLSYWGEPFAQVDTDKAVKTLRDMLLYNVSFNIYMIHGGTNFGFTAGSGSNYVFLADITSYDYDAPISEAGDLTEKYYAIKDVLSEFNPTMEVENSPKGDYGVVAMEPVVSLFDSPLSTMPIETEYPVTFEEIGQKYGFLLYSTEIMEALRDPSVLQVTLRDRGVVYLNNAEVGVLQYTVINEMPLPPTPGDKHDLKILVENQGRRNFQLLSDCTKGIVSNATLDGKIVKYWNVSGYPLSSEDIFKLEELENDPAARPPAFYKGQFVLKKGEAMLDTFLDMTGWGKGVAFINEFNLGRYWHLGPQATLYVPGAFLRPYPANNTLTLLELHFTHDQKTVAFIPQPILNTTTSAFHFT